MEFLHTSIGMSELKNFISSLDSFPVVLIPTLDRLESVSHSRFHSFVSSKLFNFSQAVIITIHCWIGNDLLLGDWSIST